MDGDGRRDVITGQYWPGDVFIFRRIGDAEFAGVENLKDETGRNLNGGEPWAGEDQPRMDSLAAAPYATDFDLDGDYDVLIGNIVGHVVLMKNIGNAREPRFSTARRALRAGGERIEVPGGDAGPVFEDWDRDGRRDLIVGAGDGSVWFYRNVGADGAPELAAGVALVEANRKAGKPYPHGGAPARSGARAKVCVTDYDGDGLVDLLVGDFQSEEAAELELSAERIARRDELRAERDAVREALLAATDEGERAKLEERQAALYEELGELEPRDVLHGFVWLYRRLPAPGASGGSGG